MQIHTTIYTKTASTEGEKMMCELVTNNVKDTVFTPHKEEKFSYMVYLPPGTIKEHFDEYINIDGKIMVVYEGDWNVIAIGRIIDCREEALGDVIYME